MAAFEGAVCVDHAGAAATATCTRCGAFLCADCALPGALCSACASRATVEPRAIGGWLILPMLALFGLPLAAAASTVRFAVTVRQHSLGALLESDPRWLYASAVDVALGAGIAVFALFIAPGFFRKRRVTITRMQVLYAAVLATNLVAIVTEALDPSEAAGTSPPLANVWPVVLPIVWMQYFRRSKRVAETFVRP